MIQLIKFKNINFEKYDNCIKNSVYPTVYAESWYLLSVCPKGFDAVILNDYEAVMPLPYKKKYGIKWIIQPTYCQQLGVFYPQRLSYEIFRKFENFLHSLKVLSYSFNEENTQHFLPSGILNTNQILSLNKNYDQLYNQYNRNRKRNLNKEKPEVTIHEEFIEVEKYLQMIKENQEELYKKTNTKILSHLLSQLKVQQKGVFLVLKDKENKILIYSVFIYSEKRIIFLFTVRNGKQNTNHSFTSILVDYMIEKYSNTNLTFDFGGSMMPGVNAFNESFGTSSKYYTVFSNQKWIKKIKKVILKNNLLL